MRDVAARIGMGTPSPICPATLYQTRSRPRDRTELTLRAPPGWRRAEVQPRRSWLQRSCRQRQGPGCEQEAEIGAVDSAVPVEVGGRARRALGVDGYPRMSPLATPSWWGPCWRGAVGDDEDARCGRLWLGPIFRFRKPRRVRPSESPSPHLRLHRLGSTLVHPCHPLAF